ncbi:DNA gyrase inhibitor SbmC [Escherichia coli]|uniref:DNA gyrase inhibitor SbmC n=1 Tax=Escherichia coli TaxID=562 RepID=UPI000BDF0C74|nr:DNA gyrase inhibitor SbmC [Escherichia coli]EEW0925678.1 DNA gyrase inhibitor SbmC [Escherichia coli]EHH4533202.1 DNA gyrase inhibitor SbmC [Escherichia coli]EHU9678256.1 DNA gyrase inhibitor SbmC [Escherichia coli]EIQ1386536.1 DNA gyrase inhibitor SbmC [Escherichia coli]EJF8574647.1 DNA gyrase inhibitor SbmC [Escherichia coli]
MNYEIKQEDKRTVAGFHLVGPWEQTVKKGFEQLMMWVDSKNIVPKEWVAVYYDNPDETPAEKLRCDTVVTVPNNFTLPENSEGVILTEISGGQYAVAVARVVGDDFAKPWYQFFNSLLQDSAYEMLPKPYFEVYLNNGAEDGYWDIEMYVAVQPKHH